MSKVSLIKCFLSVYYFGHYFCFMAHTLEPSDEEKYLHFSFKYFLKNALVGKLSSNDTEQIWLP